MCSDLRPLTQAIFLVEREWVVAVAVVLSLRATATSRQTKPQDYGAREQDLGGGRDQFVSFVGVVAEI